MKKKRKKKIRPRPRKRMGRKRVAPKRKTGKKKIAKRRKTVRRKVGRKRKRRVVRKRTHKKKIARRIRVRKLTKPGEKHKTRPKKRIVKKRTVVRKSIRKSRRKTGPQKPMLALNTDFEFFYELRDLVLKSSPAERGVMVERLNKLGRVKLAVISGIFINKENLDPLLTDLLIVGDDIDRRKLRAFLKATEAEVGKEIKFAVMDKEEFQYRLAMFDRFTRVLLESPHEKLINRLGI